MKKIFLILALSALGVDAFAVAAAGIWQLADTSDSSGNGFTLGNTGGVTFQTIGGQVCAGPYAIGKFLAFPPSWATNLDASTTWQLELHVYKTDNLAVACYWFISGSGAACVGDMASYDVAGDVQTQIATSSTCSGFDSLTTISINTWHSLIISYDGTDYRYYIDNVLTNTMTYGHFGTPVDDAGTLGIYNNGSLIPLTNGYLRQVVWINSAVCTGSTCPDFNMDTPTPTPTPTFTTSPTPTSTPTPSPTATPKPMTLNLQLQQGIGIKK